MKLKTALFIILILFNIGVLAQLPTITFTPHWLPQAQFAGYYMAQEKGFYEEEGIKVEIAHPPASVNSLTRLANGDADIVSLFLSTAINNYDEVEGLVNIAQLSQNSALMFVAKKKNNINSLADLNGKKIGVWRSGFDEIPKALINSNNYEVEWLPVLSTVSMFMIDGIDAMTVMWYNEYSQIINSGYNEDELTKIFFSDYGCNIPEDGIYSLQATIDERADDLKKFVNASMRGWEYAKSNPDEALDVVMKVMHSENIASNRTHQKWMLDRVLELLEPGAKNVKKGFLSEADFHKTQSILHSEGHISKRLDYNSFFNPLLD